MFNLPVISSFYTLTAKLKILINQLKLNELNILYETSCDTLSFFYINILQFEGMNNMYIYP